MQRRNLIQHKYLHQDEAQADFLKIVTLKNGRQSWMNCQENHPYHINKDCPYGQVGDQLWARETFAATHPYDAMPPRLIPVGSNIYYVASDECGGLMKRSGIFMPRWASRITLEIVSVRVERLNDISEADASAEGCERLGSEHDERDRHICHQCGGTGLYTTYSGGGARPDTDCMECNTYVKRYRYLWESTNGEGSWDLNPWVWVIEFKKLD